MLLLGTGEACIKLFVRDDSACVLFFHVYDNKHNNSRVNDIRHRMHNKKQTSATKTCTTDLTARHMYIPILYELQDGHVGSLHPNKKEVKLTGSRKSVYPIDEGICVGCLVLLLLLLAL